MNDTSSIANLEFKLTKKGNPNALKIAKRFVDKNRLKKDNLFAFYEPIAVEPAYLRLREEMQLYGGHDLFSAFCYQGTIEYIDKAIKETAHAFLGWSEKHVGGTSFQSATLAAQHLLIVAIQKYHLNHNKDYIKNGIDNTLRKPVILAPIHAHFIVEKIAMATGLGKNNCRYYSLTKAYDTDLSSLKKKLSRIEKNREHVVLNLMFGAGCTTRGLNQNIEQVVREVRKHNASTYNVVDAAPHFFNEWAQDTLNVSAEFVDAVMVNPQKIGVPLGATILYLKNINDLSYFQNAYTESNNRLDTIARGSWLITKDISSTLAFFINLQKMGLNWLRKERLHVVNLADYFRVLLEKSSEYSLLPSRNTVVPFMVRSNMGNKTIAEKTNFGGKYFITYDPELRIHSKKELDKAESQYYKMGYSEYDGLWVNFYPFHKKEDVEKLFEYLIRTAKEL